MRVALYARVSTSDKGQDPEVQLSELRAYCQRRDWTVVDEYVDHGVSGTKDRRPQLDRMMADANRRLFDAVVVWRFDRFARSTSHLLRALETFRTLGIEFVSYSEAIDTSTPVGKMTFTVLGAVAELERSLIVERVRSGVAHARAKGKVLGRPRKALHSGQIQSMRASGCSYRTIAEALDLSHTTVMKACKTIPSNTTTASA